MKPSVRLTLAVAAFVLLSQFSSQDSTTKGGKPAVNFYGKVTDQQETFKAENITINGAYKAIPVYQQAGPDATSSYDPADNRTLLDLSEISKITVAPAQKSQRFGNRDYVIIEVYSNDKEKTKNTYIIEAVDKKLLFDQINPAGPIEKEIKFRALVSVEIDGYKQQEPEIKTLEKKKDTPTKAALHQESKAKRLFSYVKNAFTPA